MGASTKDSAQGDSKSPRTSKRGKTGMSFYPGPSYLPFSLPYRPLLSDIVIIVVIPPVHTRDHPSSSLPLQTTIPTTLLVDHE